MHCGISRNATHSCTSGRVSACITENKGSSAHHKTEMARPFARSLQSPNTLVVGSLRRPILRPDPLVTLKRRRLLRTCAVPVPSTPDEGPSSTTRVDGSSNGHPVPSPSTASQNGVPTGKISGQTSTSQLPAETGVPHRWKITFMMAMAFILCNMDKVNMSVAVIPMASELGWTATERGLVSSSFFWGYSLTQIPAGWISTKIGGAKVLLVGVALWSFGTLIAPPAAQVSIFALCATRVLVGLGEGFAPSAATNVMARQVPQRERARAVTTVFGGLDVGSAVGLLLCGPLIRMYGWPIVFYLFAALGAIWCCFWPLFRPERQDKAMRLEERALARAAKGKTNGVVEPEAATLTAEQQTEQDEAEDKADAAQRLKEKVPWGEFFRSKPVWAIITAHFCYNWGYYTLLAWLPSYFELALGLNVEKSSYLTLIPYIAMTLMTPLVGPIADGMISKGTSVTTVRKVCQNLAFLGPAVCMMACAVLTPIAQSSGGLLVTGTLVALLSLGFALGAWARGGLYCNHQDLSPKYASALLGITNTAGALPGVLGVTAAGYMLDCTNSWALALFYPTAVCQIFGAIVYTLLASSERQSWS